MNGHKAPTRVFNSGFDGLTVTRSLVDQLPNENFVYPGDTARAPYSPRPVAQAREFVIQGLGHLVRRRVEALVITCSSASPAVSRNARERYDVPILGVILSATRHTLAISGSGRVRVMCVKTTVMSRSYDDAFAVAGNVRLTTQACPRLVKLVKAGITGDGELLGVAREYLAPLQTANIDTLILDYTHYPLSTGVISYVLGDDVVLISSSDACAQDTYAWLIRKGLLHDTPRHADRQFLATDDTDSLRGIGERLLRRSVHDVEQVELH